MRVHRGVRPCAFLPFEPRVENEPASRWIDIWYPHAERLCAVREWRRESIPRVRELQRRHLSIGQARVSARVAGVRVDVVRAAPGRPWMAITCPLRHVENR